MPKSGERSLTRIPSLLEGSKKTQVWRNNFIKVEARASQMGLSNVIELRGAYGGKRMLKIDKSSIKFQSKRVKYLRILEGSDGHHRQVHVETPGDRLAARYVKQTVSLPRLSSVLDPRPNG